MVTHSDLYYFNRKVVVILVKMCHHVFLLAVTFSKYDIAEFKNYSIGNEPLDLKKIEPLLL